MCVCVFVCTFGQIKPTGVSIRSLIKAETHLSFKILEDYDCVSLCFQRVIIILRRFSLTRLPAVSSSSRELSHRTNESTSPTVCDTLNLNMPSASFPRQAPYLLSLELFCSAFPIPSILDDSFSDELLFFFLAPRQLKRRIFILEHLANNARYRSYLFTTHTHIRPS